MKYSALQFSNEKNSKPEMEQNQTKGMTPDRGVPATHTSKNSIQHQYDGTNLGLLYVICREL